MSQRKGLRFHVQNITLSLTLNNRKRLQVETQEMPNNIIVSMLSNITTKHVCTNLRMKHRNKTNTSQNRWLLRVWKFFLASLRSSYLCQYCGSWLLWFIKSSFYTELTEGNFLAITMDDEKHAPPPKDVLKDDGEGILRTSFSGTIFTWKSRYFGSVLLITPCSLKVISKYQLLLIYRPDRSGFLRYV